MRPLLAWLVASAVLVLAACGDASTGLGAVKSCADDPSQAQCPLVQPVDSGLRVYAARSNRLIGAALGATIGTSPAHDALVAREFSFITAENALKWQTIHPTRATFDYAGGDQLLAFAQSKSMKMRGHTLVWHVHNPSWLTATQWPADTLAQILTDHIHTVLTHYKGEIYAWDVVNEALNDDGTLRPTIWSNTLGKGYIETAFRAARAADPATLLFYNDYGLEFPGAKQDAAIALIQDFKARGVPIDGVGFQAHFQINADGTGVPSRSSLISTFQRFAALGIKVHVTELDVRIRTPGATAIETAAQTQGFADVVSACVAVAACEAITVWGVTDSDSWIPGAFPGYGAALLFDGNLARKATWTAVRNSIGG